MEAMNIEWQATVLLAGAACVIVSVILNSTPLALTGLWLLSVFWIEDK